jgi:hypothetical protein
MIQRTEKDDAMEGQREEFVSDKVEYQPILEDMNSCCLCGSKLVFEHRIDFLHLRVREDADCPSCKIRMKTKEHGLQ